MHMDCSADAGSGCRVMACSCVCLQPLTHRPKLFLRCSSQPLVPGLQCLPSSGSGMSAILPSLLYLQRVVVADLVPCLQRHSCLPKEGRPHPLHGQGNLGSQLLQGVLDMAWNISPVPTNVHPFPAQQASFITMTHLSIFASSLLSEKAVSQDKVQSWDSQKMWSTPVSSMGRSGQYPLSGTVGVWKR